jgi:hypothetical protein
MIIEGWIVNVIQKAEVEATVQFSPEVLYQKEIKQNLMKNVPWVEGEEDHPLHFAEQVSGCSMFRRNMKAVSFIPLLVRLATELGVLFDGEEDHEGLLWKDQKNFHALQSLVYSDPVGHHTQEYHEAVDDKYLYVLIQLRRMGPFKTKDIQSYSLLTWLCRNVYLSEEQFRFLDEWGQTMLFYDGDSPLRHTLWNPSSIRGFQIVFEYGIRYYPKKERN